MSEVAKRIGWAATLASIAIGLILGAFQVQGWHMPEVLAIALIVLLIVIVVAGFSVMFYEVIQAARRFLEERETSPAWVSSEEPGLLDYEADGIRAQERFTDELEKLSRDTENLGAKLERHTRRFERSVGASAKTRQRRANRSAKAINKSAVFIEKRLALVEALVHDVARNAEGLVASSDLETSEDIQAAKEFLVTLENGREATAGALESIAEYRETIRENEQLNLSRTLRIATRRLGAALDGVMKMMQNHKARSGQLVESLRRKIKTAEQHQ